jgi:hypothetical protein
MTKGHHPGIADEDVKPNHQNHPQQQVDDGLIERSRPRGHRDQRDGNQQRRQDQRRG